ncbi:MAG TPA: hypothetical protein DDW52_28555 [Planctomycetaceae bacterium]|nr:hypothetical protein [Planctomycetaceae bacterium]
MKVLMLCPALPRSDSPGGMAPTVRQFESLRCAGIDVEIVDLHGPSIIKYATVLPKIRRALAGVDIVHAHYGFCGWLGRLTTIRPSVISFMGSDINGDNNAQGSPRLATRIEAYSNRLALSRLVSHVIVKSAAMAELLPRSVRESKTSVIANGVDTDLFAPSSKNQSRAKLGWSEDETVVLFPSDPERTNKGFELADSAVKIAGQRLGKSIKLFPMWGIQPEEIPIYMNAADAMTLASHAEGSPNVVKEALACELPTVATAVGDVPKLFQSLDDFQVVQTREPAEMGQALADLLSTPRQVSARGGRDRLFELELSLGDVAGRIIQIYEQLLSRPGTARAQ